MLTWESSVNKLLERKKFMDLPQIPSDVIDWIRNVFFECNSRISRKICLVPQCPEPSLDMTFIEHLTRYSAPHKLESGWTIRLDTHFLGGLRHFNGRWEIADIGLLVHFRHDGKTVKSKAAALQSKRLYPKGQQVIEDHAIDYQIGFGRLDDPEDARLPLYHVTKFQFDRESRYGALEAHSKQYKAIDGYRKSSDVPIYYQFYNPVSLPYSQSVPLISDDIHGELELGTRIVTVDEIHSILKKRAKNYSPSIADLSNGERMFGWALEYFVADLLIQCKEGYIYEELHDENIVNLFNRRTGAIAAAIAVVIEPPLSERHTSI